MSHQSSETFGENAKTALADVQLRGALRRDVAVRQTPARSREKLNNWEDLRTRARAIKDEVLLHLDRFGNVCRQCREARGGGALGRRRRWAECDHLQTRAGPWRAHDRQSKSMTTEETHLNTALEAAGMQVVETDLGEYIISSHTRRLRTSSRRRFTSRKNKSPNCSRLH